jgi:hypothetical protein
MKLQKPYFWLMPLLRLENSVDSGGGVNKDESLFGANKRIGLASCTASCMEINGQLSHL